MPRLSSLSFVLVALVLPASSLAAPPEGGGLPLVVSPAPATFAKTTVGNQTPPQPIQLYNEGEEEAQIEKIGIEGDDAVNFDYSYNCGALVQFQHCDLWIVFRPQSAGEKQASVVIAFKNGRAEESFEIAGAGVPVQLAFSPGSYDFGIQRVWENREASLQLTNSGEAAVQLNNLDIVGPDSSAFWTGYSGCWGHWLEPGESCSVGVSFGPNRPGPHAATVRATANGESFTAELTGIGGQAVVEGSPNPAEFGATTVGMAGATRTIVLTNSGDLAANYFIGIVSGGDAGSFRLLSENCSGAPLAPAASCSAQVRFLPDSAGPKLAMLSFFGDSEGGTQVALGGEGVAAAATFVPSSHDFGLQVAGAKSSVRSFAVSNEGSAPLPLDEVEIAGRDLDQFAVSGDECEGATLAPGATCMVWVRFVPDSPGAKAAKLRVSGEAFAFAAALSGVATAAASTADAPAPASGESSASPGAADLRPGRHRGRHRFRRGKSLGRAPLRAGLVAARSASPRG